MFEANDIREYRGHDVVDVDKKKIGALESVYVDTATDEPAFATVTIGLPTRHRLVFAPLAGARVGPGYLQVQYPRALVKDAPAMGTDDVLPVEDEAAIFAHYELAYETGAAGERRLARR
ncbi:PRC-barrel domain containing protein [Streptacidiphilus sp. PB12-B1b]|uniref:PRC-barrel domain-containing protein n=1 Tax=Streptacidiphilus sp. PB12-B1b TaxID=2705012 RepID=UPI0015FAA46A|nr:PRC-barrel domain-containing protein [Streptacidiphilus sp. PB12-B1b]QMU76725.1 PRC-barrel domain containing protein [Streptacidiphilus sp. PB12-B1b]